MSPEEAVVTRLLAITAVTDLVSTRVYQLTLPQTPTFPAVRVQLISQPQEDTVDGECVILRARVQVDAFATASATNPYADATTLADAIHGNGSYTSPTGLHHWAGSLGSPAYEVKGIRRIDRDARYDADELRLIRIRQDYEVVTKGS